MKKDNLKKFGIEFLSIFIAVISAFALNNWNDNRRDRNAESKILTEISNGLKKDIEDIRINKQGHYAGLKAYDFWGNVVNNDPVNLDSVRQHYFNLTRDFISIQNISGYETLKSKGLELLKNDSLRGSIISLYEYDYSALRKLEEEYNELQFQQNYFKEINQYVAPNFIFNEEGSMVNLDLPLQLTDTEKKIFLSYLWKIRVNRKFVLLFYSDIESKIDNILRHIEKTHKN